MAKDPFDSPDALEAHLRARGFVDQPEIADAATDDFFSKVLVPPGEPPYLLAAQILSGELIGQVEVGLTAYFDPSERLRVNADLAALVGGLVAEGDGRGGPAMFVAETLAAGRDGERDFEGVRVAVMFPEREPDQDFEVAHVEASRPLEPGEWEGWSSDGRIAAADCAGTAEAACRAMLSENGHPLAGRRVNHALSCPMGDDRIDVLRSEDGESLWLTTTPAGDRRLAILHDDGRRETL